MVDGLIGYSGFVGGNLVQQHEFTYKYNSKNFREMAGREFSILVCSGVSAVKWFANKNPADDIAKIKELAEVLKEVKVDKFVLISTIDVYSSPAAVHDEKFDPGTQLNHAYGTHRLWFENFCRDVFSDITIVRLPGLFGRGLKKNVIYDLLHDNCLEMINPASSFQYYYLANLWNDINLAIDNNLTVINLFTEPLETKQIMERFFPDKKVGSKKSLEGHYDAQTCYSALWGKQGRYIYSQDEVLTQLAEFIREEQN